MTEPAVSLRDYFDHSIETLERHINQQFDGMRRELASVAQAGVTANAAAKEAVLKAEIATERRLEGLNELRRVIEGNQATLLPRAEAKQRLDGIEGRLDKLEDDATGIASRNRGLADGWSYLVAAVGFAALVIGAVMGFR
jgi:hypothetical protein